ncbi:hypothetical protein NEOC84_000662|nr:hypothetical protein [Neochlamydia sp. AcF84]
MQCSLSFALLKASQALYFFPFQEDTFKTSKKIEVKNFLSFSIKLVIIATSIQQLIYLFKVLERQSIHL